MRQLASILLLPALFSGCAIDKQLDDGDDDGTDDGDTHDLDEPLDVDNLVERLALAECGAALRCFECRNDDAPPMEACVESVTGFLQGRVATAMAAGLVLDTECAEVALSYFEGVGCDPLTAAERHQQFVMRDCDMFVGTAMPGDACEPMTEVYYSPDLDPCTPGTSCIVDTCVPLGAVGDPCERSTGGADVVCMEGAFCTDDLGCQPRGDVGDPCVPFVSDSCVDTAYCHEGTCRARVDAGEPCPELEGVIGCAGTCSDDGNVCVDLPAACEIQFAL